MLGLTGTHLDGCPRLPEPSLTLIVRRISFSLQLEAFALLGSFIVIFHLFFCARSVTLLHVLKWPGAFMESLAFQFFRQNHAAGDFSPTATAFPREMLLLPLPPQRKECVLPRRIRKNLSHLRLVAFPSQQLDTFFFHSSPLFLGPFCNRASHSRGGLY